MAAKETELEHSWLDTCVVVMIGVNVATLTSLTAGSVRPSTGVRNDGEGCDDDQVYWQRSCQYDDADSNHQH